MRAISLSQPWPWAILHLGKPLDNRSRKDGRMPAICRHRGPLLLHAAKSWDDSALAWMKERGLLPGDDEPGFPGLQTAGGIFARCVAVGHIEPWECSTCGTWEPHRRVHCTDCEGTLNDDDSIDLRWWMGGYALLFTDVEPTPFVPCKGRLGLWTPPDNVLKRLDEEQP